MLRPLINSQPPLLLLWQMSSQQTFTYLTYSDPWVQPQNLEDGSSFTSLENTFTEYHVANLKNAYVGIEELPEGGSQLVYQTAIVQALVGQHWQMPQPTLPLGIEDRIMPQITYTPRTEADQTRYIRNVTLQDPVIFKGNSYFPGVSLREVLLLDAQGLGVDEILVDHDTIVLNYGPTTTNMRLQVPGYSPDRAKTQMYRLRLRKSRGSNERINKGDLLLSVARGVRAIFDQLKNMEQSFEAIACQSTTWTIGEGIGRISVNDVWILSLRHVSQGTWQPTLYLDPHIGYHL